MAPIFNGLWFNFVVELGLLLQTPMYRMFRMISNTDNIGRRGESLFCIEPEHIVCAPN
jgi:hypothetical protein